MPLNTSNPNNDNGLIAQAPGAYPFVCNAQIESAEVRFDRGFILTCWVFLDYDGSGQGFGGFVLGGSPFDESAKCAEHYNQTNIAADFIGGVMAVAGVERFSDLKGNIIRVGKDDEWGDILAIGHPIKPLWYDPRARFKSITTANVSA